MALLSTCLILPIGVLLAWLLARREWRGKAIVETLVALPLVVPPVVTGLVLLKLFGRRGPLGHWLHANLGMDVVFTWKAVVIALAVMSIPLLVRTVRSAIEEVNPSFEQLARAVVRRPRLLLLDEPLSALDAPTRQSLRGELRGWLRHFAIPTLLVTHDRQEAVALGDDLVVMHNGRIVQQGPLQEVFSRPCHLAVASILAVETIQPAQIIERAEGLATITIHGMHLLAMIEDLPINTREVVACIRAEDVMLSAGFDTHASARNRLPGVVRSLTPDGPLVRVELDCGFPLLALLTKQACQELSLAPGSTVHAMIKAQKIHLIPHA